MSLSTSTLPPSASDPSADGELDNATPSSFQLLQVEDARVFSADAFDTVASELVPKRDIALRPISVQEYGRILGFIVITAAVHSDWRELAGDPLVLWSHAMNATQNKIEPPMNFACQNGKFTMIRNAGMLCYS